MSVQIIEWHGCYDDGWTDYIVRPAFAHPAKYARGLITRIFKHMLSEGMIAKGSTIVDPFGGIGTGGVIAAGLGLRWFGCELEPKFFDLGQQNFAMHAETWRQCGDPMPVLVQGDSRKLRDNLWKAISPESTQHGAPTLDSASCRHSATGDVDAVVSSPPFAGTLDMQGAGAAGGDLMTKVSEKYGNNKARRKSGVADDGYGQSQGQLGSMKTGDVDSVITSPPYEGSFSGGEKVSSEELESDMRRRGCQEEAIKKAIGHGHTGGLGYGTAHGQLGQEQGDTFWHAARDIVAECFAIMKPGGWSAWVCKDFVRNKARVTFCDDWCKLLESQGFIVTTRVHAMLVKETRDADLFGGDDHVRKKERKSFFRRLAEKKGSPPIDYEEVIFARKP